jgi:arylsulfatase
MADQRPNILWLCSDQQRWDTIGRLGNPHIKTPNLDWLASEGTAFCCAYAQSPICTPSRASMLTGRYPASHCVYRNGNEAFPPHEVLVTKTLAEVGYDCGLVGKLHLSAAKEYERRPDDGYRVFRWSHHPTPNFARGHDYESWLRFEKGIDPHDLYRGVAGFCGPGVPAALSQSTWCGDMAIRFIEERRNMPWLLSVNFFDPHAPFDAPPEYLAQVDAGSLPLPLWRDSDAERWRDFERVDQQQVRPRDPRQRSGAQTPPERPDGIDFASKAPDNYDALAIKANYYAMIQQIDAQVGRLIETLRRTDQLENTIVLYHSDHGELLGDHGLMLKGCRFFDGLVRVPMIWSWPNRFVKALESRALVELVDIAPTLLEAVAIPQPWQMQGRSLLPILGGRADPGLHKSRVVSEFWDSIAGQGDHTHGSMVFDGRWKSNIYHGHPVGEIFDLTADPGEFDNLWNDPALRVERLKMHLDALAGTISNGPPRVLDY